MSPPPPSASSPSPAGPLPPALAQAVTRAYAYGRIALGVTALVAPGPVGQNFGIGSGPQARVAARHLGARDLVAGVGMVLGRRHGAARGWYEAAALTDAIDAAVAVVAGATGAMPRGRAALVTVLAGGSAVVGAVAARLVDEAPAPPPGGAADQPSPSASSASDSSSSPAVPS